MGWFGYQAISYWRIIDISTSWKSVVKLCAMSSCLLSIHSLNSLAWKWKDQARFLTRNLPSILCLFLSTLTQFTCMKMERHGKILVKNLAMSSYLFLSTLTQFTCMKVERHGKILNKKLAKCSLSLLVNIHSFHLQENGEILNKKLAWLYLAKMSWQFLARLVIS